MQSVWYTASHCITPLGLSTAATFGAVRAGRSGLRPQAVDFAAAPQWVATLDTEALATAFAPWQTTATAYTKLEQMSILAVAGALARTAMPLTGPDTLLVYCTTKGNIELLAPGTAAPEASSLGRLARTVAGYFGFANAPLVVSNACISSLQGLLIAQRLLAAGRYRHAVVVGADQVSRFTLSGFHAFKALSPAPCRPFDAQRQGINLGEAAVAVVLTTAPAAGAAGAVQVVAGSSSNDAHHISAPSRTGAGLYQAISTVLRTAGVGRPDFIGAHGTATLYNDEMEAQAFHRADLGTVPLHSLKGYFGHTLGASGLLEATLGVESLRHNELIPSRNYAACGTSVPLQPIGHPVRGPLRHFLKTSSGFGGCNAAVLFAKIS